MSFFIRGKSKGKSSTKRKAGKQSSSKKDGGPQKKSKGLSTIGSVDEEIPSDSDEIDSDVEVQQKEDETSEEEEETAQEKKLRLTKQYLAQIEVEEADRLDDDEFQNDLVADRLKQDLLEQAGKLHKKVAHEYSQPSADDIHIFRGHQLAVTCLVITPDSRHVFSASKDCSIIKWDVTNFKKVHTIPGGRKGTENKHIGHTAHVLSMAISSDGKFLVSGDRNKLIHVWDADSCKLLHTFKGHRDAVSGLVFRKGTHQLFSASHDRSVKIWNLDEMAYVETLFGHQDSITAIDSGTRDRAVTSGGRDCTLRVWKVVEESQLVFHGHGGSIDCVSLINEEHFISGADDNSISLWGVRKKKPLCTVKNAHSGTDPVSKETHQENWITSVAALPNTDLVASGSKDGCIRLWRTGDQCKFLEPLFNIPVTGFVNSLQFSQDGCLLVAGIGQEHRLGRWWRLKEGKNSIMIIKLRKEAS